MPRASKSQWDFGELFPPEQTRKVLSVSELTQQVKRLLEKQIGQVWVTGEITNLRAQSSGHIYFTIKDGESQLSCVLFRNEARESRSLLQDGQKAVLQGELTVYEPRGQYQLRVTTVELQGIGALQQAFERLKQKLNAEGLFAPERKRPIPLYPECIGLVTSPTGAAIRDVLHVIQRRNPGLMVIVAPCRVQGQEAAREIAGAIRLLNQHAKRAISGPVPQLILATRGGGSLEDLWAFNEEVVARAIFESDLPVISAVGHEIDFTISDFVADLRAATPSAAAEIITEGVFSSCQIIASAAARMRHLCFQHLSNLQDDLETVRLRLDLAHPRHRIDELLQRLDDLQSVLLRIARHELRLRQSNFRNQRQRLSRLLSRKLLDERAKSLRDCKRQFLDRARRILDEKQSRLRTLSAKISLLGPEQVLARGYSITTVSSTGQILRNAGSAPAGAELKTRLHKGEVKSIVKNDS